jgi:lysophospholipase L1-like esterase
LAQATIIATEIAAAAVAGHDGLAEAHGGNRSFAALKAKTAAGFVYVGVNPKRADADYVPQHNRRLDELPLWCVRNAVDFYDVSNAFNADPRGLANLLADPVHPNADGYTLYAQMLAAPIVT